MVSKEIELRVIRENDFDSVVKIDEMVYGSPRPGFYRRKIDSALNREEHLITSRVAVIEGKVVGFVMGELYLGEFGIPEKTATIDAVAVDPEFQHRGVARALMEELKSVLKKAGVETITTRVEWNDWNLLAFFASAGFKPGTALNLKFDL